MRIFSQMKAEDWTMRRSRDSLIIDRIKEAAAKSARDSIQTSTSLDSQEPMIISGLCFQILLVLLEVVIFFLFKRVFSLIREIRALTEENVRSSQEEHEATQNLIGKCAEAQVNVLRELVIVGSHENSPIDSAQA